MSDRINTQRIEITPELPLTNSEDLGLEYLRTKTEEPGKAALDAMLGRVDGQLQGPGAPPPDSPRGQALQPPLPPAVEQESGLDRALDIAADPARGVVEAPRQIAGGALDAVRESQEAGLSLFTTLFGDVLGVEDPTGMGRFLDMALAEEPEAEGPGAENLPNPQLEAAARAIEGSLSRLVPELDDPKSATGGAIRATSQFLTGFLPALRGAKAVGLSGSVAGATAGAVTDFTVFDPHEARLANLWQDLGLPETALTGFLAADPGDSEMEGRFKNLIEGAGIGALAEGVFRAAHLIRAARIARRGEEASIVGEGVAGDPLADARARFGEVEDRDFLLLGDPNEPLFAVEAPPPADGAAKLRESQARVDDAFPPIVEAPELSIDELLTLPPDDARFQRIPGHTQNFLKGADGSANLTVLPDVAGQPELPLRLRRSTLTHLNTAGINRDAQRLGYRDGFHLMQDVVANWDAVREARNGRLMLTRTFGPDRNSVAIVTLAKAPDSDFWRVLTAGARRDEQLGDALRSRSPVQEAGPGARPLSQRGLGQGREDGDLAPARSVEMVGEPAIRVNFAAIDEPDDVQAVLGDMVEFFAGDIDEARRGRQSFEETAALADQLGMTPQDLLARRKGEPFSAEEALAARRLWAASAERLLEAARIAASPQAGAADQFNFRRMLAMHHAIQAEVIGARTETARALNAWKIPAGGSVEKARALDELLNAMGGQQASAEMARRLAILEASGAPDAAISDFARRGWGAATMDAIKEVWVNGLLFSPKTHIVNITSNAGVAVQQILERGAAIQFARLRGINDGVVPGEAAAMTYGLISGLRDAFRLSWRALVTEQTGAALGKIDLPRNRAFSADAFNLNQAGAAGRTVDFLGTVFRVPGRLLGAEDEFFKTIGYRMELHAQAVRQAAQEGHQGAALDRRMADILANPPEHIRIAAADAALYNTFTNQTGWFGDAVLKLRGADKPLSPVPFILPFVRTPVNIARYAFERTPLAPLVGQWRADVAAGGARRDLALARMATGTTVMLLAADLADSGMVTGRGPRDPGEREALQRQGWQPYSIKVGERWYSYNRADPFGMTMGFAADINEAIKRGDIDADDVDEAQEVIAMAIAAVSQVTINKTYMQGMAEFMEMVSNPQAYSESYINQFVGSFVPFSALAGAVETAVDPALREVNSPADAVFQRIAGLSDSLLPRRDLWGEVVKAESGLGKSYDFFAPWSSRAVKKSPIDAELTRLVLDIRRIPKKAEFEGVRVNFRDWPEVYDAYTRLAGNGLKHPAWQLGTRDYLDAVVEGRHPMSQVYQTLSDGKDGGKAGFIRKAVTDARKLARQAILTDPQFARFAEHIRAAQRDAQQRRQPSFAQGAPAGGVPGGAPVGEPVFSGGPQ